MNELIRKSNDKSSISFFKCEGKTITDNQEIASNFNLFFSKIGEETASKIPPTKNHTQYLRNGQLQSLFLAPTQSSEIKKVISKMKAKNSSGDDGIS